MPVYDKPMIYYPLATMIAGGISEILVITRPEDQSQFVSLLGNGSRWGVEISYAVQQEPNGLGQAFVIGAEFIGGSDVALALGDNIFYSDSLQAQFSDLVAGGGATVFGYRVSNPKDYGVLEFDPTGAVISIEEKPTHPKSSFAVPGLYFYDSSVVEIAHKLRPSPRGEYEITDINREYIARNQLRVILMGKGSAWLDTGTFETLTEASKFISTLERRQGLVVGSPELEAWKRNLIDDDQLKNLASPLMKSGYGRYLMEALDEQVTH